MKNSYAKQKNAKDTSVYKMRSQGYTRETKIYQNVKEKKKKRGKKEIKNHFSLGFLQELCFVPLPRRPIL